MKKPSTGRRRRAAAAFTLIELMVATGILAILVLMVGGLFSQASSVWDAGYVRAEGGMNAADTKVEAELGITDSTVEGSKETKD